MTRLSYDELHFNEGITRKLVGDEFVYYYVSDGKKIDAKDLERIKKLKIPPAWSNLWVSRDNSAMIQAIGTDAKGRKQYRYHQVHIEKAEKEKFIRLKSFIKAMPKLDKIISIHNSIEMFHKNRIIAIIMTIVKNYYMRVGKEVYARTNKSYGVSSLRKKHVKVGTKDVKFKFKGKSNQRLQYTIVEPELIADIKLLMKLQGDKLFQYVSYDDRGREIVNNINDRDLNIYIQEHMGAEFSIKDFRTYAANHHFIKALLSETRKRTPKTRKIIKKNLMNAFISVAYHLKHTKAISKKSYVVSFATEMYQNDPDFFVKHKNEDPDTFVLQLLDIYEKDILESD